MTNKEDLESSKALDPPSHTEGVESSAEEGVREGQEKGQLQLALRTTIQENTLFRERVIEL